MAVDCVARWKLGSQIGGGLVGSFLKAEEGRRKGTVVIIALIRATTLASLMATIASFHYRGETTTMGVGGGKQGGR
jgi:hypothetical protein